MLKVFLRVLRVLRSTSYFFTSSKAFALRKITGNRRATLSEIVSRGRSSGQVLSANARFFPTNGLPAPLEMLLRAGGVRLADPAEHRLVELIGAIDAEVVPVAVRAERLDLLDAWIGGRLLLGDQTDAETCFSGSGAPGTPPHPEHDRRPLGDHRP